MHVSVFETRCIQYKSKPFETNLVAFPFFRLCVCEYSLFRLTHLHTFSQVTHRHRSMDVVFLRKRLKANGWSIFKKPKNLIEYKTVSQLSRKQNINEYKQQKTSYNPRLQLRFCAVCARDYECFANESAHARFRSVSDFVISGLCSVV